jgi:hypothetical protein
MERRSESASTDSGRTQRARRPPPTLSTRAPISRRSRNGSAMRMSAGVGCTITGRRGQKTALYSRWATSRPSHLRVLAPITPRHIGAPNLRGPAGRAAMPPIPTGQALIKRPPHALSLIVASSLLDGDLNRLRQDRGRLWHVDGQHSIRAFGADLRDVDILRQRKRA